MSQSPALDPSILREYDIRGIVGRTLSGEDAFHIGRAFGSILSRGGAKTVAVGYDGRLTSPDLETALVRGLRESGLAVWRIGLGPTPMLYFAVHHLNADGGIMVTGSHNPPEHNGFKMMVGRKSFYGEAIRGLGDVVARQDYVRGAGSVETLDVTGAYIDRLLKDFDSGRPMTVAWDAGNGAAGAVIGAVTARLPGRHILLNEAVDGRFPAHHPDPTVPENLHELQASVSRNACDFGIAFDGDADRIGVVDATGAILWGDQLMVILARAVLAAKPGATIIADVKASQVLFDEIAKAGGKPLMWRTGHSLIKSKMAELGAPLAGEMSGHIFFADRYYGFDDALYAAIRLVGILGNAGTSLAEMRAALPAVVNTPELRFPCEDSAKFGAVDAVKARLKAAGQPFNDVDGVRVATPDGWWLLRASNTQAVLVARCEARDEAGLDRLKVTLGDALAAAGVSVPTF
jgi:phosphomannomutase